jgi:2-polyprenyl-3-methyl-5-hydroxy-6-metoxy-1,4-benzoquinol methylase
MRSDIAGEARAFDAQIEERIAQGHIPDLRRAVPCEYFYNNPWRHPDYVQLDFGQIFTRVDQAIRKYGPERARRRVLEFGCGPGFMSLELARGGHDVLGIDVSEKAIAVARDVAASDPWQGERGPLTYEVADFVVDTDLPLRSFDAVVTVGALHHFPDQNAVGRRIRELLCPGGIVVAQEPTRDRCTLGLAAFVQTLRVLLSLKGGFFEEVAIPKNEAELLKGVEGIFRQLHYEGEQSEKLQSPNDNEAGYAEMQAMLTADFETLLFADTSAFFHEIIGGLRLGQETNAALARYLRDIDTLLVRERILPATEFFFVGRPRH